MPLPKYIHGFKSRAKGKNKKGKRAKNAAKHHNAHARAVNDAYFRAKKQNPLVARKFLDLQADVLRKRDKIGNTPWATHKAGFYLRACRER